ncbi:MULTISPECIES: phospho-N-acetylmuramoyl-pentapeptide-transferase [Aerococcus]|uniref:Phospho-N-acetylmuramoyl-pentapeptide-transferase n=2 Tax=Aerococcus TaxID=1375 RepID=A0A178HIU1_9LACT|nr:MULTISPECIES: phospho-N-acetylmuramoyl-pentapeptide-transferase [Aerococcus]KAA9220157.1 phospho-N-acetylmuramoyl-pentapeptide-transferase [Aerococcus loyolae]KAA9266319.1 phospho-N-acetylmuramoyl-pentapeptide-transferase [Aerococcus loyolae]MCY3025183.1 phospho-N-acetylmuramoyl-pentapeptide-transferase [Aerococcus loyolae]MCY3027161.1 phospho-N-acetylmuramoyl-pentapeptide-transferase [Aerococcus loyolae]MCY3029274.1 phospho-N-acetylmuramoyl-pentapeptide-transferase [Aerococcus loyolae]
MLFTFILSFLITVILMPIFIQWMHAKQFGQEILAIGPSWHKQKSGTPTMGGLVFLFASLLALTIHKLWNSYFSLPLVILMLSLILFAGIGFVDDFLKIFKKQNEGLTSKQKFLSQLMASAVLILAMYFSGLNFSLPLPFGFSTSSFLVVFIFAVFWITGFSNAFNLTDGIDGLASGNGIISLTAYLIIFLKQGQMDLALFNVALIASLFGFLIFNMKTAKVFMGDAGSLAIGASLAVISLMTGNPWSLLVFGFIYVVETASVMIQVTYFKKTGKRIFKMTPIHHHFEMEGWSEWKIDFVLWGIAAALSVIGIFIF